MRKVPGNSRAKTRTPVLVVGSSAKKGPSWLDRCGFSATPCLDAKDALKMLSLGRHQAVLCDLELVGMDGTALMNAVCADFPDVAVVAITRPRKLRHGVLAMFAGASGYIQTPLHPEIVVASLRNALNKKRLNCAVRGLNFSVSN